MKVYITKIGTINAITYSYHATSDISFKFHLLSEVGEPWQRDAKRLRNLLAISCAAKIKTVELEQSPWFVDAIVEDV